MTTELTGSLLVLALVDSTSFGTLLIPLWLMLAPTGVRPSRVVLFLSVVAGFYLAAGLLLLSGADALTGRAGGLLDSRPAVLSQLLVGAGLLVWSFRIGRTQDPAGDRVSVDVTATGAPSADTAAKVGAAGGRSGRLFRWRERATSNTGGRAALVTLALSAATLEVATMLPYLAATGLLASSGLGLPMQAAVLAGYCVVMVLPALALLVVRVVAHRSVQAPLQRLQAWLERTGTEATAWLVGIVGFLLARDAATRLPEVQSWLERMAG